MFVYKAAAQQQRGSEKTMAANYWTSTQYLRWLFVKEEISAKRRADLATAEDYQEEAVLLPYLVAFTQAVGKKLRFPMRVTSTATTYLRRFYLSARMRDADPRVAVPACLYLAAKVEEMGQFKPDSILEKTRYVTGSTESYSRLALHIDVPALLACELLLLERLGFDLVVFHPYHDLERYAQDAKVDDAVLKLAGTLVNDSQRCDVGLVYPPFIIALAALYVACVHAKIDSRPWFDQLNVNVKIVHECSQDLLANYGSEVRQKEADDALRHLGLLPASATTPQ
jgi:cyclin C